MLPEIDCAVQSAVAWRSGGAAAADSSRPLQRGEASVSGGLSKDPATVLRRGLRTGAVSGLNVDLNYVFSKTLLPLLRPAHLLAAGLCSCRLSYLCGSVARNT